MQNDMTSNRRLLESTRTNVGSKGKHLRFNKVKKMDKFLSNNEECLESPVCLLPFHTRVIFLLRLSVKLKEVEVISHGESVSPLNCVEKRANKLSKKSKKQRK